MTTPQPPEPPQQVPPPGGTANPAANPPGSQNAPAGGAGNGLPNEQAAATVTEYWSLGRGILLSRKIDLLALAAFLLSVATISIQLSAWLKGPNLTLLPPDQVFIWKQATYSDGIPRALFGATLIYVNKGEKGYAAIVRREALHVAIVGKDFEQGWDKFATFAAAKSADGKPAIPFSVDGGATETHQTMFVPWPRHCPQPAKGPCDVLENHIKWSDFIDELRRLVKAGQNEYEFKFTAQTIDSKSITASCKIAIDEPTVAAIDQSTSYYGPTCYAE